MHLEEGRQAHGSYQRRFATLFAKVFFAFSAALDSEGQIKQREDCIYQIQFLSFTVTPMRISKSVTISDGLLSVSLYPINYNKKGQLGIWNGNELLTANVNRCLCK